MIEIIKFVKAAVCKRGHDISRLCFRLTGGTIQANNGKLAIQAPFPSDIDATPNAAQFEKAIRACEEVISLSMDGGKLLVKSGRFKSHVDCVENESFRPFIPSGNLLPVPQAIIPILEKLYPFIATDETRPWACGVRFVNNSAIATNSICIVEHWLPVAFPVIANIPRDAIAELLRLRLEPQFLQASRHAVTFHLDGGAWITCTLTAPEWPDVERVFSAAAEYGGAYLSGEPLAALLGDVAKVAPFAGSLGAVHFHKGRVSTVPEAEPGTSIDCPFSPGAGIFRADSLSALRGIVDRVGFGAYPAPVPFFDGSHLRGVVVGFKS